MQTYYIVGLGNPGERYANTRHNVGWQALDHFVKEAGLPTPVESAAVAGRISRGVLGEVEVAVLYPSTFMNKSGSAVVKLLSPESAPHLIVVHDDIDLPLGTIKVSQGRGAGSHNGVRSIIARLGRKDFIRVRIGIASTHWLGGTTRPAGGGPLERFVLKPFGLTERLQLPSVYAKTTAVLYTILREGAPAAMNEYN